MAPIIGSNDPAALQRPDEGLLRDGFWTVIDEVAMTSISPDWARDELPRTFKREHLTDIVELEDLASYNLPIA